MAGAYTSVIIVAPDEALLGSLVEVNINVWNSTSSNLSLLATAMLNGEYLPVTPTDPWLTPPGVTSVFTTSFTMPNKDVVLTCESLVRIGEGFVIDDTQQAQILLAEPPPIEPEFHGLTVNIARK